MKKKTKTQTLSKTTLNDTLPQQSAWTNGWHDKDSIDMGEAKVATAMFSAFSDTMAKSQQTAIALTQLITQQNQSTFNNEEAILSLYERVMERLVKNSPLEELFMADGD